MRTFIRVAAVATLLLPLQPGLRAAQSTAGSPDPAVDATTRQRVIDGAIEQLKNAYIFFDVAEKMAAAIRERAARNEYDAITGSRAFADRLTTHLQEVSKDKHLRVLFNAEGFPERRTPTTEERDRMRAAERRGNYGFQRVERLDGNVGYIELRGFSGSPDAGPTAVAAMNFAAGTDALMFDLRANGGGSPAMIGLLSSYLFDDVVHLNDFYIRERDEHRQFWTSPHVQGQRYGSAKPVYILTSQSHVLSGRRIHLQPEESEARNRCWRNDWRRGASRWSAPDYRSLRHLGTKRPRDQPHHENELGRDRHRARHQGSVSRRPEGRPSRCAAETANGGDRFAPSAGAGSRDRHDEGGEVDRAHCQS